MIGPRTFIIVGLIVLLGFIIWYPLKNLQQKPSFFLITMILIPILVCGWMEFKWLTVQQEATRLTVQLSGKEEATASCQRWSASFFDAQASKLGYVYWDGSDVAHIKYAQCKLWEEFLDSDKKHLNDKQIFAVGTIIHEATHVKGVTDEAVTQCLAIKQFPQVLLEYKVPENLIPQYVERLKDLSSRMPTEYLNGTC